MSPSAPAAALSRPRSGVLGRLAGLLSSITLGVCLLSVLFLYASVGSAGILYPTSWDLFDGSSWAYAQMRQWRPFEMTEYEWFNWWPFKLLVGLISLNIVVATLRRIPFRALNLGVWMIHSGILVLVAGSLWYFGAKIEGDTPVLRRLVVAELPGGGRVELPAIPGGRAASGDWRFEVTEVNPSWPLLSGPDEGTQTFSVTVSVQSRERAFMRQLLDGFSQYDEDLLRTGDPARPMARATKELGRRFVDEDLEMSLAMAPQSWVYLANWVEKSWALYLREQGAREWAMRPLDGVPMYNDYVGSLDEVWLEPGDELPLDPLDVRVPAHEQGDPAPGLDLRVTSYLRYALLERRHVSGGERLDPAATVQIHAPGRPPFSYRLVAFDPERNSAEDGVLQLLWAGSASERDELLQLRPARLEIRVPAEGVELEVPLTFEMKLEPSREFTPVAGGRYAYRIDFWGDDWELEPGRRVSMAQVSVTTPERTFKRWVFARPQVDQVDRDPADAHGDGHDHDHGDHGGSIVPLDTAIDMAYHPGRMPAPLTLVAGPGDDDLALLVARDGELTLRPIARGATIPIGGDTHLTVTDHSARGRWETRPAVVPLSERDRDMRELNSMVRVGPADAPGQTTVWARFHSFPLRDVNDSMRRYPYRPTELVLPDGRVLELILSRRRLPLPRPVVLEDFELITHSGGYTGSNLSILNWTSQVRFAGDDGWDPPVGVSVNAPAENRGYWYYQAQWDPPIGRPQPNGAPDRGLHYTVLGVGNRQGVGIQLLGCCIAVLGMLYAFYVKPVLLRRAQRAGVAAVRAREPARRPPMQVPTPAIRGEGS